MNSCTDVQSPFYFFSQYLSESTKKAQLWVDAMRFDQGEKDDYVEVGRSHVYVS